MKVLVTGATGFIGGHLVKMLVRDGFEIKALARQNSDTSLLEKLDVELVEADIRDEGAMKKAIRGCPCVYHLAAKTTKHHLSKKDYYAYNVQGTRNVAQAAISAGVNRLVYASTIGVYGTVNNMSIDENTAPSPDSFYRETKLAGEKEVIRSHRDNGLPVVVARLGIVFGPGSCSWLEVCRKIAKGNFRVIGRGENHNHMVYVEDLIEGLRRCGDAKGVEGKTYLLTDPNPVTLRQVLAMIAKEMGVDSSFDALPVAPFRSYQRFSRLVYRFLGIELPRSRYYDLFLTNHIFISTKARDELDFSPKVSLKDGLGRMIQWYREAGYLTR